jgi:hypothetical protein
MSDLNSKLNLFNIPLDVKHDHSAEAMEKMRQGVAQLTEMMGGEHERCIEHVILYAELNIRFFFLAHLVDKNLLLHAFKLFMNNMMQLFVKNLLSLEEEK